MNPQLSNPVYLKSLFSKYDSNHSNTMDATELQALLNGDLSFNLDDAQIRALLMLFDENNSGKIDWNGKYKFL